MVQWKAGLLALAAFAAMACETETPTSLQPSQTNAVYVSKLGSDATGDGTKAQPYLTISAALAAAPVLSTVCVSEGVYNETVALKAGVSLYGGYSPASWEVRDPAIYITTIRDTRTTGGTEANPNCAVSASSDSVNSLVQVDGFTIQGNDGVGTAGLFCTGSASPLVNDCVLNGGAGNSSQAVLCSAGAQPTIQHCQINGAGDTSTTSSVGVHCSSASPRLLFNTISGGAGKSEAIGIWAQSTSTSEIWGNAIEAGSGSGTTYAIACDAASPVITNNTLRGGSGQTNYGVASGNGAPTIHNNTIDGGNNASGTCYGIYDYPTNLSNIRNNIIVITAGSTKFGINTASTVVFNNCIHVSGDSGVNFIGTNGNVGDDPALGGVDGFHLTASSAGMVVLGGMTLSAITTDKDGASRTVPYSIGAYEYNP